MIDNELEKELQDGFQFIRKSFFPKWDKKNEWKARLNPDEPGRGACNDATKTINIRRILPDKNVFYTLLVHEICHAVTHSSHLASRWKNRMAKASDRAIELGLTELGHSIEADVESYRKAIIVTHRYVYAEIRDFVSQFPDLSYEDVIGIIAKSIAVDPDELEKGCRRCRKVFDSAKKEQIREENRLRKERALIDQEISNLKKKDGL